MCRGTVLSARKLHSQFVVDANHVLFVVGLFCRIVSVVYIQWLVVILSSWLQDRKAYRLSILICFAAVSLFFSSLVHL